MNIEIAKKMLNSHLMFNHSLTIDDVEITDVRGYWRTKELCDENCHHSIHGCLGCGDRTHHTISYTPYGRDEKGRFLSCYRVWDALKEDSYNEVERI